MCLYVCMYMYTDISFSNKKKKSGVGTIAHEIKCYSEVSEPILQVFQTKLSKSTNTFNVRWKFLSNVSEQILNKQYK